MSAQEENKTEENPGGVGNENFAAKNAIAGSSSRSFVVHPDLDAKPSLKDSNAVTPGPGKNVLLGFAQDQEQMWTSPERIRLADATWLVPLGGLAAGLFATDRQYSASLSNGPSTLHRYTTASNAGLAALAGAGAGLYLMSFPAHNEHWRETGFLAGEAALNSLVPVELMKYSLGRERPGQGNGSAAFFHGGTSFPSEHSAVAWSIAGIVAHEYSGVIPQLLAYGTAAAIDFSRLHGRQHFPSDVLVGSILGYLSAQNVYNRRHDPELGGRAWASPSEFMHSDAAEFPAFAGSPYVPLDSWIYPALERLVAMGYIKTAILGLRPWTRSECARLLSEAEELQPEVHGTAEVRKLEVHKLEAHELDVHEVYEALSQEFDSRAEVSGGGPVPGVQLESLYLRTTGIAGQPLTDNQHFGQTILNDYGRPYQQGFNAVAGMSSWAGWGPFVLYLRGEYQSAPSAPAPSSSTLAFIAAGDDLPSNPPLTAVAAVNRLQWLDSYVGMNLANWQISFGKQSLWWGPGEEGAMLFTNNAAPLNKMFRVSRVSPIELPFGLGVLRTEVFLGQLAGQQFINNTQRVATNVPTIGQYGRSLTRQPFLSGGKVSFKFTPNFEVSMSKTTIYGGPGNPLTLKTLLQSALARRVNGEALGDGRAALDFTYRIPGARDWLSFYVDAFQEDEISPLNRPYKAAFESGLYLVRVPRISKLDLRVEGGTTSPINFPGCVGCYYSNGQYVNGYTNQGQLMGTWIGRAAQGEAIRTNYWLGARKKIGIELRHRELDRQFLPLGGSQNDAGVNADFQLASGLHLSGTLQYEAWQIPLLAAGRQSNVTASFELGYWPQRHPR